MSLRIGVIDSGVHLRHPHIVAMTLGTVIGAAGANESFADVLGHGTAVMAAIQEKAPAEQYYAVKIFGDALTTTVQRLAEAITWCAEKNMDVVNLSLGVTGERHRETLQPAVDRAIRAGTILVSAWEADGRPAMPGSLEGVIGVDVDWDIPRNEYRQIEGRRFAASGYPRSLPGLPRERNLNGISFAVANMTGFVARALGQLGRMSADELARALARQPERFQYEPELANA